MLFSSGTFDAVEPNSAGATLPLRLTLLPDRARTMARVLLVVPALCTLFVPAAIAAFLLLGNDASVLGHHDGVTYAALSVLPVLWLVLAVLAALSILPRLRRKRLVTVTPDHVSVLETDLSGARSWQAPIRSYRGIAHHVRASAGVVVHEVILVHDIADRSVLLHTASIVHQASLDHYCNLLRLPLIAARAVYRLHLPLADMLPDSAARADRLGTLAGERQG